MSADKKLYQLNQSISKAINAVETSVKEKHVRSTIIGTFRDKGAITFWVVATRLPLQDNRIVAWKFCHVLHKVLREGHANCLQHSQRHVGMIEDLGKLWMHLKEGYGKLIQMYCALMITKIKFHGRNPRFPGNLQVTGDELDAIGENDINNYFQMSVEIFDYMDDVLALQSAIFDSLDINRTNSMTNSGQCRVAPLIPCIQDSNQLYDFSVKLLFKLHSMLPADTLSGHRERFLKQFKLLKKFYQSTHNMQYFKNLITIPSLPENPPNFLIQSELRTYVPPIVILPPEEHFNEEQDLIGNLIDTSDTMSQMTSPDNGSDRDFVDYAESQCSQTPDYILERDNLIEHLQSEISRLRNEIHCMVAEHRTTIATISNQVNALENDLISTKAELNHEKEQRNLLIKQQSSLPSGPEYEQRIAAAEKRAKGLDEKFQKLKTAYTQMREEHIALIRQKAEGDKHLAVLKRTSVDHEEKVAVLQATIDGMRQEKNNIMETHTQSSDVSKIALDVVKKELTAMSEKYQQEKDEMVLAVSELEQRNIELTSEKEIIRKEKENLSHKYTWCYDQKSILESELQDILQQKEMSESAMAELSSKMMDVELALSKEISKASSANDALINCSIISASNIIKGTIHELDNPAISSLQCGIEYFRSCVPYTEDSLNCLEKVIIAYESTRVPTEDTACQLVRAAHLFSTMVIQGLATSNTAKDIVFGEKMAQKCRELANKTSEFISYINSIKESAVLNNGIHENGVSNGNEKKTAADHASHIRKLMEALAALAGGVVGQEDGASGDSVEGELADMDKVIEEAAARIEEMLKLSRAADSGIKLEVNEKILDACTSLMAAVRELVKKSRGLQAEIVSLGRGTNTAKEFYKRNHQWTEGLISAAKAVAMGAKLLLTAADKAVTSGGKLEHLMVASQEIAASTAQLVVASRVRAARGSARLGALAEASRAVSTATGAVIATAKTCSQMVEESEDLDMSGMSWQAGRRLEMESRVRVLELEQALDTERLKLAALRRTHYRLADEETLTTD